MQGSNGDADTANRPVDMGGEGEGGQVGKETCAPAKGKRAAGVNLLCESGSASPALRDNVEGWGEAPEGADKHTHG